GRRAWLSAGIHGLFASHRLFATQQQAQARRRAAPGARADRSRLRSTTPRASLLFARARRGRSARGNHPGIVTWVFVPDCSRVSFFYPKSTASSTARYCVIYSPLQRLRLTQPLESRVCLFKPVNPREYSFASLYRQR